VIRVNGEPTETAPGTTVAQLVADRGAPDRGVAVAVDGEVVPMAPPLNYRIRPLDLNVMAP
jgi:sulfur carrier protein